MTHRPVPSDDSAFGDDYIKLDVPIVRGNLREYLLLECNATQSLNALNAAYQAEKQLADLGNVSVDLWPGWASTVPEMEWRVEIRVTETPEEGT